MMDNGDATNEETKIGPKKATGLQRSSKNVVVLINSPKGIYMK